MSEVNHESWEDVWVRVAPQDYAYRASHKLTEEEADALREQEGRPMTADEAYALISRTTLIHGGGSVYEDDYVFAEEHSQVENESGYRRSPVTLCVMQLANVYNALITGTLPEMDQRDTIYGAPSYRNVDEVDSVIEGYMVTLNDGCSNENRQRLIPYIPRLLNTRVGSAIERYNKELTTLARELFAKVHDYVNDGEADYDKTMDGLQSVVYNSLRIERVTIREAEKEKFVDLCIDRINSDGFMTDFFSLQTSRYVFDYALKGLELMLAASESEREAAAAN